jgi:hypothetical protein
MRITLIAIGAVAAFLAGCASTSLYGWNGFDDSVNAFYKNEAPDKVYENMRNGLAEIEKKGKKPGPGYYAHLAVVSYKMGLEGEAANYLAKEKQLYPDSVPYIDNVLSGFGVKK